MREAASFWNVHSIVAHKSAIHPNFTRSAIQEDREAPTVPPLAASLPLVFCRSENWYWGLNVPRGVEPLPSPHQHPIGLR